MDRAEVPPGVHLLRLDIKDMQGREATAVIKLRSRCGGSVSMS